MSKDEKYKGMKKYTVSIDWECEVIARNEEEADDLAFVEWTVELTDDMNPIIFNIKEVENEPLTKRISLIWCIEDVRHKAKEMNIELTDKDCSDILGYIDRKHDCDLGVSWITLECAINEHMEEKMTREEKVDELVKQDLDDIKQEIFKGGNCIFTEDILRGKSFKPYYQLTDVEIDTEYKNRITKGE